MKAAVVFLFMAICLSACSTPAAPAVGRERILSAARQEVQSREKGKETGDFVIDHDRLTGRWRVCVVSVFRKVVISDAGVATLDADGSRELIFSNSGKLLDYRRLEAVPKWVQPHYQ